MLEQELKTLLLKNLELTEENNRLLRSMRRRAFWGGIFKLLLWVAVIFGLPLVMYYLYVAPYIANLQQAYGSAQQSFAEWGAAGETIRNFLSSLGLGN